MNLQTGKFFIVTVIAVVMMYAGKQTCRAQAVSWYINPKEIQMVISSTSDLTVKLGNQAELDGAIDVASYTQAQQMSNITGWERKFSNYLADARSYAQKAQAAYGIYTKTIKVLINLEKLRRAVAYNPEGIVASSWMTETYVQVADEIVIAFYLFKKVFAKGGDKNMLNGSDRARVWWDLNDTLDRLNDNLYRWAYNIAYYNLVDVWRNATQGMLQRTNATIAWQALDRWKRVAKVEHVLNK